MDWRQFVMDFETLSPDSVEDSCTLAVSGILSEQVEEALDAYRPWIGYDEIVTGQQGGQSWARLTGQGIED